MTTPNNPAKDLAAKLPPYAIRNKDNTAEVERWSNEFGWVEKGFDRFSAEERRTLTLPVGGEWEDLSQANRVREHLLAQAEAYAARHDVPRTAWDQIGARSMSEACRDMAKQVSGMTDAQALAWLVSLRDTASVRDVKDSIGLDMNMSYHSELERIIDPISREHRGWIEVSEDGLTLRPRYRRMLGINQAAGTIVRGIEDTDEQWAERRRAWLLRYHPEIEVIRSRTHWTTSGHEPIKVVTVKDFADMEHTHECELEAAGCIDMGNGIKYRIVQVFSAPKNGVVAEVRQRSGPPQPVGVIELDRYRVRVVPAEGSIENPAPAPQRERA